jgi:hypothetical protein
LQLRDDRSCVFGISGDQVGKAQRRIYHCLLFDQIFILLIAVFQWSASTISILSIEFEIPSYRNFGN